MQLTIGVLVCILLLSLQEVISAGVASPDCNVGREGKDWSGLAGRVQQRLACGHTVRASTVDRTPSVYSACEAPLPPSGLNEHAFKRRPDPNMPRGRLHPYALGSPRSVTQGNDEHSSPQRLTLLTQNHTRP
eukprot:scaffold1653_cov389-Prasinococcus_capsulatus_cf.AAC.4